jgi:hypothetical protein
MLNQLDSFSALTVAAKARWAYSLARKASVFWRYCLARWSLLDIRVGARGSSNHGSYFNDVLPELIAHNPSLKGLEGRECRDHK